MTHVTCRLTAKNRDQLRNPMLGNRVWATFTFMGVALQGGAVTYMSMNLEIRQRQSCIQFKLRASLTTILEIFARSVGVKLLQVSTAIHGCSAADVSPAYAALSSLVRYTNRPCGHQRRSTKRLTIAITKHSCARLVWGRARRWSFLLAVM